MSFVTRNFVFILNTSPELLCLGLLLLIHPQTTKSTHHADHKGTYFVTSYLDINSTLEPALLIISQVQNNVSVSIRAPKWSGMQEIRLWLHEDASTRVVALPSNGRMESSVHTSKGLEIRSSYDIAVYSINKSPYSKDATLVLPTDALGEEYVVTSYKPDEYYVTKAGIVGIYNNTVVLIEIPMLDNHSIAIERDEVIYRNGDSFRVHLDIYDTFQLNSLDDISGIKLSSNVSFALISGSSHIPLSTTFMTSPYGYGHIEEQVIPTNAWGTTFITIPFGSYDGDDVFKVMSSCDNTTLLISTDLTNNTYYLSAFESLTIDLENTTESSYVAISANKPIALLQYYCANHGNTTACDPYLITIPPVEQEEKQYLFSTPDNESQQLVTLVMNSTHAHGLVVDGVAVDIFNSSLLWLCVTQYDSNYTAIRLLLESGYHNITNTYQSATFSAISQSSPIGLKLDNLYTYTDITTDNDGSVVIGVNTGSSGNGDTFDDGSGGGLEWSVIAVIVTLGTAVFFVIVCILGFVVNETLCKQGCRLPTRKIAPYHVT